MRRGVLVLGLDGEATTPLTLPRYWKRDCKYITYFFFIDHVTYIFLYDQVCDFFSNNETQINCR